MRVHFNGHNYNTQFIMGVESRLSKWFGRYKWPVTVWVGHGDGCCGYWITDPQQIENAIRMDDALEVRKHTDSQTNTKPKSKLAQQTKTRKDT